MELYKIESVDYILHSFIWMYLSADVCLNKKEKKTFLSILHALYSYWKFSVFSCLSLGENQHQYLPRLFCMYLVRRSWIVVLQFRQTTENWGKFDRFLICQKHSKLVTPELEPYFKMCCKLLCCLMVLGCVIICVILPTAGFTAATFTNPIWFVKTRLQLDSGLACCTVYFRIDFLESLM